jgi:hypothetical protein
MTDFGFGICTSIIGAVILACTWAISASVIADECEKIGQFYVAKRVYECKLKETK